jgi:hypothetical protein
LAEAEKISKTNISLAKFASILDKSVIVRDENEQIKD